MTAKVPAAKKSIDQDVFEWEGPDGKTFQMPVMDLLAPRQALVLEDAETNVRAVFSMLDSVSTPSGLGEYLLDVPSRRGINDLMEKWTAGSGVTPGESVASGA